MDKQLEAMLNDAHDKAYQTQALISVLMRLDEHESMGSAESNDRFRCLQSAAQEQAMLIEYLNEIEATLRLELSRAEAA